MVMECSYCGVIRSEDYTLRYSFDVNTYACISNKECLNAQDEHVDTIFGPLYKEG